MVITLTKSTVSNWLAHVKLLNDHVDTTGAVVRTSYINWAEGSLVRSDMVITLTKSTVSNWLAHDKLLNDHVDPTGAVVRTSYINWAEGSLVLSSVRSPLVVLLNKSHFYSSILL